MTFSACAEEVVSSRIWRETARELRIISARVWYTLRMVERGGSALQKWRSGTALCCSSTKQELLIGMSWAPIVRHIDWERREKVRKLEKLLKRAPAGCKGKVLKA